MPDYKQSKIYMIEPKCEYEVGDVYYGATTQALARRMTAHRNYLTCKSKILLEKYGRDNVKIVLVKLFPCNSRSELDSEEAKYIRNNKCVNKYIPTGIISEDSVDYKKQYHQSEAYKESERIRRQTAEYKEYQRQYYQQRKKRSQSI